MAETTQESRISRLSRLAYLVLPNLIPLYGIFFLNWNALMLVLAYFMETVIAVLFHAVRLWYVHWRWGSEPVTIERSQLLAKESGVDTKGGAFQPLLMLAVFGFFCFVQLMVLGGFAEKALPDGIFPTMYAYARGELAWVLLAFTLIQIARLTKEVFMNRYAFVPVEELFFQPFRRILVQQITVILGGFFILFGGMQQYLIILVVINLAADLFFFFIENARLKALVTHNDPKAEKQYEAMKRMMRH